MTLISAILFLIVFLVLLLPIIRKEDIFSPAKIFTIIWALTLGLAELKFSRLQHEWNGYGWLMLSIGIFSFLLGCFIIYSQNYEVKILPLSSIRNYFQNLLIDKKKYKNIILLLFLMYIVSFLGNYLIEGYLPLFHYNPGQSRAFWGVFGIGLLIHSATAIIILITGYILIAKPPLMEKLFFMFLIIVIFVSYLTILQRFNLMFAILSSIVVVYYTSNALRPRNALIFLLLIVGLMYSVQFLRTSSLVSGYLYNLAEMKISPKYAIITEPYMYFVMNPENFVRAVNRLETHTYGYYTFNFVLSLSGTKKIITDYVALNNFPFLNSSYNTYSALWDYYRDFGIWGLSGIPFLLGFFISSFYYKLRSSPSLVVLMSYSIFIFIIAISFFVNTLGLLHFFFNSILIIVAAKYIDNSSLIKTSK